MSPQPLPPNAYLTAPLRPLFVKTALPIIFVTSMSGLLNVVDAIFLGVFVGPQAVSAVTVIFPFTMLLIAAATLVTSGMASLLARRLGAGDIGGAQAVFAAAHGLAMAASAALMLVFASCGRAVVLRAAAGDTQIAAMAYDFLGISVAAMPVTFLLSLHADALRNEGRAPLIAVVSLAVSLANIGFNYLGIAVFEFGVAGSAGGTAAAQLLALAMMVVFRLYGRTPLPLSVLRRYSWRGAWGRMIALGAPQSLGFMGIALVSATIILAVQISGTPNYGATTAAYGIITRIFGFAFLPLLGLGQAMQAIVGNNVGAGAYRRSDAALRYALAIAALYCLAGEAIMLLGARSIGDAFVDDPAVVSEVARILPQMAMLYVITGPILMLASYFQSLGDALRAAILNLARPFLFAPAAILTLVTVVGEPGIWMAPPIADSLMVGLVLILLWRAVGRMGRGAGLFMPDRNIP